MSKIICDVCGTTYPENAAQCPICGCAKPGDAVSAVSDTVSEENASTGTYTHVKGGRFSKSNVKKRNKANNVAAPKESRKQARKEDRMDPAAPAPEDNGGEKTNKGLVITAVVLLLAIIAVVVYIAVRFFLPVSSGKDDKKTETTPATSTVATTEAVQVGCTEVKLADTIIELTGQGQAWLLNVTTVPADTTDTVQYVSSDPAIVTVSAEGRLTAVASGQATITVTCGSAKAECTVICNFGTTETTAETTAETAPDASTEATEADNGDPNATYTVYFYGETREDNDVTLSTGESVEVTLEDEDGNEAKVTWETDDTDIVEIDGTTFTAMYPGTATITTKYGGKTYTIIFRVY